jgi:uncharacterized repeat protein (TIGR01451 family)
MKKIIVFLFLLFLSTLYVPRYTLYTWAQYGQYGDETPSYSLLIDKMVAKPGSQKGETTQYFDNLSPSDPRFVPGQDVWFKIKVKNTANVALQAVEVKDYVPEYILPIEGPGKWDPQTRTITFNAGDFAVDEEKTYYLKMRVYSQDQLPSDKGLFCLVNRAVASNNNVSDDDTAQFCIEKQVLGVTQVPTAGPEMGLVILAGNLILAGVGIKLKKISKS